MSRTITLIILGVALFVMAGVLSVVALLVGRSYFLIADQNTTIATPISVLEIPTTAADSSATATVPAEATDAAATALPATETAPATSVPATTIYVLNTQVQYVMAQTDVNMRSGPGTGYNVIGWVSAGQIAKVTGISSDNGWWRVVCPDGSTGSCWITARSQYTQPTNAPGNAPPPPVVSCTDSASLITDVTIPDGTLFMPSSGFNKTWRIKNTGTCTWDGSYRIVHGGGDLLNAVSTYFPLRDNVFPGQTADLTINMVSPATPGTYQSNWKLQNSKGQQFGVGRYNSPFWVKIVVTSGQNTNISGLIYRDMNQNGTYDSGEPLVSRREVWLIPGTACQVLNNPVATTISGSDGRYVFSGNFNGSYCVGLIGDGGLDDVVGVAVVGGQVLTNINLKALLPGGSISGWLWNDYCRTDENGGPLEGNCVADAKGVYHADGMIQPTEGYISGVTILLQAGPCAGSSPLMVGVTDASGQYNFSNLTPGTYCVSINAAAPENVSRLLPGDWTFPARGVWFQEVTLQVGTQVYPVNFGWDYLQK